MEVNSAALNQKQQTFSKRLQTLQKLHDKNAWALSAP